MMRFVERDGVRVHFEVVGEGPSVVLLHGSAGDRTMWRHAGYVDGLEGFFCVLVDSRGRGLSDRPAGKGAYRLEEYVADVRAVIDALGAPRVALWGYSSGAHVAAAVAGSVPERVAALITVGWIADMGTPEERDALIQLFQSSGMPGLNSALERDEGILLPPWLREQFLATDPGMFAAEIEGFGDGSRVRASLGAVRVPVLLWWEQLRTWRVRRRGRRRSCRPEMPSPCPVSDTSGRSLRVSWCSRTCYGCCAPALRFDRVPDPALHLASLARRVTWRELHPSHRTGRIEAS